MNSVGLFRNLNLGHPGSPTSAELVEALGGRRLLAASRANGTVVFEAADPEKAAAQAIVELRAAGYRHSVIVRTLEQIRSAVGETLPIDPGEGIYRSMISFYDVHEIPDVQRPYRSPDGLVEIRILGPAFAHSVCWKPRQTAGNVTGSLEQLLPVPVTTRTVATLQRLVPTFRPAPAEAAIADAGQ